MVDQLKTNGAEILVVDDGSSDGSHLELEAIAALDTRVKVVRLRRNFGHIVLDLPHGFNEVTLAGLEVADRRADRLHRQA